MLLVSWLLVSLMVPLLLLVDWGILLLPVAVLFCGVHLLRPPVMEPRNRSASDDNAKRHQDGLGNWEAVGRDAIALEESIRRND